MVTGCVLDGCCASGGSGSIYFGGYNASCVGNTVGNSSSYPGICCGAATGCAITGNMVQSCSTGITINPNGGTFNNNVITGNASSNNGSDIVIASGDATTTSSAATASAGPWHPL